MPSLSNFRVRWLDALKRKDANSIVSQLTETVWDTAAFKVVNEAVRIAPPAQEGGAKLNGLVFDLLKKGFVVSQYATIRRMTDKGFKDPNKAVYSLVSLLNEIEAHHLLLTREKIFEAEHLDFNCSEIDWHRDDFHKSLPSIRRHEQLDRLCGVTKASRSKADLIAPVIFGRLRHRVDNACHSIHRHVDKFIAHAATPESRAVHSVTDSGQTLNQLWKALQTLCETTAFVANFIIGDSCPVFLPYPSYDQFTYIDRPLVTPENIETLRDLWDKFERNSQQWINWGIDEYETEFAASTLKSTV